MTAQTGHVARRCRRVLPAAGQALRELHGRLTALAAVAAPRPDQGLRVLPGSPMISVTRAVIVPIAMRRLRRWRDENPRELRPRRAHPSGPGRAHRHGSALPVGRTALRRPDRRQHAGPARRHVRGLACAARLLRAFGCAGRAHRAPPLRHSRPASARDAERRRLHRPRNSPTSRRTSRSTGGSAAPTCCRATSASTASKARRARCASGRALCLHSGVALEALAPPRLRVQLALYRLGGESILDAIAASRVSHRRSPPSGRSTPRGCESSRAALSAGVRRAEAHAVPVPAQPAGDRHA